MPKKRNSLVEGLKSFGRALSPGRRSKKQAQASSAASSAASSTSPGATSLSGAPTQVNSSQSVPQVQPGTQPTPTTQNVSAAGTTASLPVISVSSPPPPGGVPSGGNQAPVLPSSYNPNPALTRAIEEHAADLSDDDRKAFMEARDIMGEIQRRNEGHAKQSVSRALGSRVEKVLLCMKNFVGSVSICIQHHPDISSLVVGGFNCVLLLALGYIEFFDKITSMMDRIGGHLTYLTKYGEPIFHNSTDVQNTLKDAYCDLLDFLLAVRKVFTEKDEKGSYINSVWIFMKIQWESFEYKFQPIEERFAHHALMIVRLAGVEALITNLEAANTKQREKTDKKRREILKWLSSLDYQKVQDRHFKKHLGGTGQWLLDDPKFLQWRNSQDPGILWCHGGPGAGKTILASLVADKISTTSQSSADIALSFVYCNYKEVVEAETYLRTIIKQLCQKQKTIPYEVIALFDKHFGDDTEPTFSELQDTFTTVSALFGQTFIVIDALDECASDQRDILYSFLRNATSSAGRSNSAVKAFITSRKEDDIRRALSTFPIVEIEAIKVNKDIKSYVEVQLDQYLKDGRLRLQDLTLKDLIISALVDRAGGMFLWVEFQLKHICSQTSDYHIRKTLGNLPEGLDETYLRIINVIKRKPKAHRELARRVLMWIAYATEPLDIFDLRSFVGMEKSTQSHGDLLGMMPSDETIMSACANLVMIDAPTDDASQKVRFVHFSVQEFLLDSSSIFGSRSVAAELGFEPENANEEMATSCLAFLLQCGRHGPPLLGPIYPQPIMYIVKNWNLYIRGLKNPSEELLNLTLSLFNSGFLFNTGEDISYKDPEFREYLLSRVYEDPVSPLLLAWLYELPKVVEFITRTGSDERKTLYNDTTLHLAARINAWKLVGELHTHGFNINQRDENGCTPLFYAASKEVCQSLLELGARVDIEGGDFANPLQAASARGRHGVVQLLIEKGVDVNVEGGNHGFALHAASYHGHRAVVEVLLARGADVNANGGKYGSALQAASLRDSVPVVKALLNHGADVNAKGGEYGFPLQAASLSRRIGAVNLLLEHGADVNAEGGYYGFALQAASTQNDDPTLVELLLSYGANVNAEGGHYGFALHAAASHGNEKIVELLLSRGANVHAKGGYYGFALHAGAFSGLRAVVEPLLAHGADLSVEGGYFGFALHAAAASGNQMTVEFLLARGADINARGGAHGSALQAASPVAHIDTIAYFLDRGADVNAEGGLDGSALQAAARADRLNVVKLLLSRGANINAQGGKCGTPLMAALAGTFDDLVYFLLAEGADLDIRGGCYHCPLQAAAFRGSPEIVQMLLTRGADVNEKGGKYGFPLQAAAANNGMEVVKTLIQHGADVNARGGEHGFALHAVSSSGSTHVVSVLLSHGADINAEGGTNGSALQAAAIRGNTKLVKILLEGGANVNAKGGKYGSALSAAKANMRYEICELLRERGAVESPINEAETTLSVASVATNEERGVEIVVSHYRPRETVSSLGLAPCEEPEAVGLYA